MEMNHGPLTVNSPITMVVEFSVQNRQDEPRIAPFSRSTST